MSNVSTFLILSHNQSENSRLAYSKLRKEGMVKNRIEAIRMVLKSDKSKAFSTRMLSDILQVETNSLTSAISIMRGNGEIYVAEKIMNRTRHIADAYKLSDDV
jgi:hypothetical protein